MFIRQNMALGRNKLKQYIPKWLVLLRNITISGEEDLKDCILMGIIELEESQVVNHMQKMTLELHNI